MDSEKM